MSFKVLTRVDRALSVDPSYIVRYQVFEGQRFLGDGVAQYHRLAEHNDIAIPESIRGKDGKPLAAEQREEIVQSIHNAVKPFIINP